MAGIETERFYCLKCQKALLVSEAAKILYTGFHRSGTIDYRLGLCYTHEELRIDADDVQPHHVG